MPESRGLDAARGDYRVLPESPAPATWTTAQDVSPVPPASSDFDERDRNVVIFPGGAF